MSVETYDPKKVFVIVGGQHITGFQDGSMVTVERNEDAWTLQMGTDGYGTRSKSNNRSGRITINLMQTSGSNFILSNLAQLDELGNGGVVEVMVQDSNGKSLHVMQEAWVVKRPSAEYGKEATNREWIFESDALEHTVGGN